MSIPVPNAAHFHFTPINFFHRILFQPDFFKFQVPPIPLYQFPFSFPSPNYTISVPIPTGFPWKMGNPLQKCFTGPIVTINQWESMRNRGMSQFFSSWSDYGYPIGTHGIQWRATTFHRFQQDTMQ